MPGDNDKPVKCWSDFDKSITNCRFCVVIDPPLGGVCKRNPTSEECFRHKECFAGEPKVVRSCGNCGKRETFDCFLFNRFELCCYRNPDGWHCSDWEQEAAE